MLYPHGTERRRRTSGEEAVRRDKGPWIRERLRAQGEAAAEQARGVGSTASRVTDLTARSNSQGRG